MTLSRLPSPHPPNNDNNAGPEMKLTDKQILVTGADGFIGSHLTEMLLSMGVGSGH